METIANNKFYEIYYNKEKNRIIYLVKNFWSKLSDVPNYLKDMQIALKKCAPNFTFIADVSTAKTHPKEIQDLRAKAQQMVRDAGVFHLATVVSNNVFADYQIKQMYSSNKMKQLYFKSIEDAEAWLDQKENLPKA